MFKSQMDSLKLPKKRRNDGNTALHYQIRWILYVVATLLFTKLTFPLLFTLICVLLALMIVIVGGIFYVQIPNSEKNHLRTRFPRLKFTRTEEWSRQVQSIKEAETMRPSENESYFIQSISPIINLLIRDFVLTWFRSISQNDSFPNELSDKTKEVFSILEQRANNVQIDKLIVLKILPIVTKHFNDFVNSQDSIIGEHSSTISKDLQLQVAKEYDRVGRLNRGVSLQLDQEKSKKTHSRNLISKVTPFILPADVSHVMSVSLLVRELLSNVVLLPIINLLSNSDFWNQTIIRIASGTLKDRDQVRELRNVINRQYSTPPKSKTGKLSLNDRITPQMKQPEFEKYIRSIDKSTSLSLLKQLKYYVAVQISRSQRLQSKSDKFLKYCKRLDVAKAKIDSRIISLAENPHSDRIRDSVLLSKPDLDEFINNLSLPQILGNPSALSIFMEFMEQRSRTDILQFWIAVNGIKDPLEDPLSLGYEEELSSSADLGGAEDIFLIFDKFFDKSVLQINKETHEQVRIFVQTDERSLESYLKARKLILVLQMEVFKMMQERDLAGFKNSDLILKLLSNEAFEQSLVRQVDFFGDDYSYQYEDGENERADPETNKQSLTEIENALTEILVKNDSPSIKMNQLNQDSSNSDRLKNEIFGNEDQGFLDEKPLFVDEADYQGREEEDVIEPENEFFPSSHDAMNLKEAIKELENDIDRLSKQSALLDPLILKAELIDNSNELRLLRKSKTSYQREIDAKELHRQQLIVQDNENSLFGKTKIEISNWIKGTSRGKDYIVYVIEIQKKESKEGEEVSSWVIGRRFSQFYKLNMILQNDIQSVSSISFPKKKIVLKFQQRTLIDERLSQLQIYLNQILKIPEVCQHKEFRKFLTVEEYNASAQYISPLMSSSRFEIKGAANKLYSGISSGIDMISSRNASSDNLSKINDNEWNDRSEASEEVDDMRKELEFFENQQDRINNKSYVKPVTDLFIALFPLNSPNTWLRGRAIIVVLQQFFGSTIEKHIKSQIANFTSGEKVTDIIQFIQNILWPNGKFMESSIPRTSQEKIKTESESRALLESLIVDISSRIVGQSSARTASNRLHSMLQNEILNMNLIYEIIDTMIEEFFPEAIINK